MMISQLSVILLTGLSIRSSQGFCPTRRIQPLLPSMSSPRTVPTRRYAADFFMDDSCSITPEGFGFSTPAERVLREANRGMGYYAATGSQRVIDVMEAITTGPYDVALVFDGDNKDTVIGLFTETDYIRVSE